MEGKNGLDRGLYQAAYAWFLQGLRGIDGVVTHRNHIIPAPRAKTASVTLGTRQITR